MRRSPITLLMAALLSSSLVVPVVAQDTATTPDLLPGVDLVTEEVEPGVERILSDGIRDLSGIGEGRVRGHAPPDGLAVAPDGAVWVYAVPGSRKESLLIRLGDPDPFPMAPSWLDLKVGPDGTLWTQGWDLGLSRLGSGGWSEVAQPDGATWPWGIGADGTVWVRGGDTNWRYGTSASVARLDAEGWQEHLIDLASFDLELRHLLEDSGGYPDEAGFAYIEDLRVDPNGDVWAALSPRGECPDPMVLVRYDGETWSLVDPLGVGTYHNVVPPHIGADGTMWVYLETGTYPSEASYLARLTDGGWSVFSNEDGVDQLLSRCESWGLLGVDHGGAVWVRSVGDAGVRVFDGTTWRQYLDGHVVDNMEVAPDGRVWVLASDHLYVITPEAVAGTE